MDPMGLKKNNDDFFAFQRDDFSLVLQQDPEEGNTPLHLAAEEGTKKWW